jgi:uncharacterized protein YdhG (YjbR/CyaY superfamily)
VKPTRAKTRASSKSAPETVEQYLANVPETSRPGFNTLHAAVRSAVPRDAEEIISYKIPAFRRGVVLVWFAAFADHCSLFPTSSIIAKFKNELKGYATSKGTIHFPLDQPVPAALIKRIVKARVAEVNAKH